MEQRTSSQLEVRDLRMVLAVAAEGSLTAAGTRLGVSQPALSRHLGALELRLGTSLFTRTGLRMIPTPAGELLLRHATEVVERVEATEAEMRELREIPKRVLRVGSDCYTGYHWLPPVLNRFAARHPDVTVEIAFEGGRQPMKLLRAGEIDVAVLTSDAPRSGFAVHKLFLDEYVAVVAPSHPWAGRSFVEAEDFRSERLLLIVPPDSSTVMKRFIVPSGVKPRVVADVQLIGAVAALAESGYGVGAVPNWTIAPEIRAGRLVSVRLGRGGIRRTWVAAIPRSRTRERSLVEFVRAMATGGPLFGPSPLVA
ncbi:MAG TPA: LysR family transcriptional regulator [Gemmatimonadaceae bacterium]|nr:LysR family transcriptional regulator [Gemmatimonadaceae bacterium]